MTEQATEALEQSGGDQGSNAGETAKGLDAGTEASPFDGLEADQLEFVNKRGFKGLGDLVAGYQKDRAFIDSTIRYPGDDDPEKLNAFLDKIRPENAEGYKMPDGVQADPAMVASFNETMLKAGVTPHQYGIIAESLGQTLPTLGDQVTAEEIGKRADTAFREVTSQFGGDNTEAFNEAKAKVNAFVEAAPELADVFKDAGLLDKTDGAILDARLFHSLLKVSDTLKMVPDGGVDAEQASTGDHGIDPETGQIKDAAKAAELFKSNPELYRSLTSKAR